MLALTLPDEDHVGYALAEGDVLEVGDHDGYGLTDVLPVAEGEKVAVTEGLPDALALALALADALAVSLCAYTEERERSTRIRNILRLFKKKM